MMKKTIYTYLLLSIILFTGCELKFNDFKPSSGEADFTKYIAIGDSYSAGYTDGALGARGQESSVANIIAGQLSQIGNTGMHFKQPLVKSGGSISVGGTGYIKLQSIGGSLAPVPSDGDLNIFKDRLYDANAPINNLSVPGAKLPHLLVDGYSELNPFFARFASGATTSILKDAMAQEPTFVSMWIGGNDVLTYAVKGGVDDVITSSTDFANYMNIVASSLFKGETKGIIANIPSINDLPFFNYIQYNALVIDQTTADLLNKGYEQYNAVSEEYDFDKIEFVSGANPFVIKDEKTSHPAKIRQMKAGEKVLLLASTGITNTEVGLGSKTPMGSEYVLDIEEVSEIETAIEEYNKTIKGISDKYDLALVDLNSVMNKLTTDGMLIDGNAYSTTFISGGAFSLDGIHATERGGAIIANQFIEAINDKYNANISKVNINQFTTVIYP